MDKQKILGLIIQRLEGELQLLIQAAVVAKEAATDVESKPENKYDTRGLEQAYLAGAQAKRSAELKESIHHLKNLKLASFTEKTPVDVSALVTLEDEETGSSKPYFILPLHGGIGVDYKGTEVLSLSPESLLASLLFEKFVGDSVELKSKTGSRVYWIREIS